MVPVIQKVKQHNKEFQKLDLVCLLFMLTSIVMYAYPLQAIYVADMIVVMDNGHVKWVGSPADSSLASYMSILSLNEFNTFSESQNNETKLNLDDETSKPCEHDSIISNPNEALDIVEVETRKEGRVESAVYK